MGGNCAVTLRTPDGTVYAMDRWTNTLPWGLTNMKLVHKDPEHIKDYLNQWLEMKQDWEIHRKTKKYKCNMTGVYAPYPYGIRPSEYGIVIVDMVNDEILSHQMYSAVGKINQISAMIDDDAKERLFAFANAGRVIGHHGQAVINNINEAIRVWDMSGHQEFHVDMKPFIVTNYARIQGGWREMLKHALRLAFTLTPEEEADWNKRISEEDEGEG